MRRAQDVYNAAMSIAGMFKQSPFEPLGHHMAKAMECVRLVPPMFEAVRVRNYGELEAITKTVFKTEHEADIIKDEIRQTIPKTFFLPVYRGDLLGYLKLQDDMADSAEDLAVLLTLKRLEMPESLTDSVIDYVRKVVDVCEQCYRVTEQLQGLVEAGFSAGEVDRLVAEVAAVEKAEWEADRQQYALGKGFFALEDEIRATDIFLWSRVIGELGQLANFAEKTGDRVRRMLTSH